MSRIHEIENWFDKWTHRDAQKPREPYRELYNLGRNLSEDDLRQAELDWQKYAANVAPIYMPRHQNIRINDNVWYASPYEGRFILRTDTEDTRKALHGVYSNAYSGDMKYIKSLLSFGSYYTIFKVMGDIIYSENQMSMANMSTGSIFGNPNEETLRMVISYFNSWLKFYIDRMRELRKPPLAQFLSDILRYDKHSMYKHYAVVDYSMKI